MAEPLWTFGYSKIGYSKNLLFNIQKIGYQKIGYSKNPRANKYHEALTSYTLQTLGLVLTASF